MSARILIVDDEPHIRTVMRLALESSGYGIGEASSGEEALELVGEGGPKWDLFLLDERMPGIDGLETLRRLRRGNPDAIVIMVTAFASIELAVDAMKFGATDFVRKPMTPETLRAAVDGALIKVRGEWPPAPAVAATNVERPYEVGMFNGFRLRHVGAGATAAEQRFDVIGRDADTRRRVLVRFSPEVVGAATSAAGRPLDDEQDFWIRQAAFALTHYVWNHADAPPDGLLVVTRTSADLLEAARGATR
jgi:DNA-binding response OmpR family regulator